MESFIILSYRSHLPGELSHIWTQGPAAHGSASRRGNGSFRYLALLGVALGVLQTQTLWPQPHRMFIRFIQPFFLAVLLYAGSYVIESQVYTSVTILGLALLVMAMVYKYLRSGSTVSALPSIHPAAAEPCTPSSQNGGLEPITLLRPSDSASISESDLSMESPSSNSSGSAISESGCELVFSENESDGDESERN